MSQQALSRNPLFRPTQVLNQLHSGQLFYVRANRGNGMIICHTHYAEIVGPGSAVGGVIDLDCVRLLPLGKVALTYPESRDRQRKATQVRRQWMAATRKIVDCTVPLKRAQLIISTMSRYFGAAVVADLEDEVLSNIVGVLPDTLTMARQAYKQQKTRKLRLSQASRIAATVRS